jgi:hypothetical protein
MNYPHHGYRPEEAQQSAEAPWEDPPVAHDAPKLRADEFDPVWVAESEAEQREAMTQHDLDRLEEIITSEHFRTRRPRSPNYVPPPPQPLGRSRGGLKWTLGTFTALVVASSLVALYTTGRLPMPEEWQQGVASQGSRLAALVTPESQSQTPTKTTAQPKPRLVVKGASAENNEEILIGVTVESPREGATGVISGLAQGTTLSSGRPWGSTGWTLPASELATTYLRPPAGFTGVMEYTVALQLADGTIADRQTMRLEWTSPTAAQAPQAPHSPAPAQQQAQVPARTPGAAAPAMQQGRAIDPEELAAMVQRGEQLLNTGDIASARLLLRRAAEARDARAAFALAGSYDPIVLKRLGVYGSQPDVATARDWYEKARQYGSREAPQRLELLASQYR